MKPTRVVIAVLLATTWISINEFIRNTFVLHDAWVSHYQEMGQSFPETPVNGAVWGLWSLVFAVIVLVISTKFDIIKTTIVSWVIGFAMMWIVIGNLGVLPMAILPVAVPWSVVEAFGAAYICSRLNNK
ncbi:MAG TPA: hypothetical protein PLX35_16590 [Cyclobacteriaceae bacterium]|nr:hypothetical protein [Cyclobacteriaceae bacterium]